MIIFATLMFAVSAVIDIWKVKFANQWIVALIMFAIGLALVIISGYQFRKVTTTVDPLSPHQTTTLITTGFYRYSRNPMYIGFFLFLLAWGIFLGSLLSLILLPVFVYLITENQIKPEERILTEKFGSKYQRYLVKVRRWV
ncbi:methyltransferase family protein [Kaarinaea lacus]